MSIWRVTIHPSVANLACVKHVTRFIGKRTISIYFMELAISIVQLVNSLAHVVAITTSTIPVIVVDNFIEAAVGSIWRKVITGPVNVSWDSLHDCL